MYLIDKNKFYYKHMEKKMTIHEESNMQYLNMLM